MEIGTVEGAVNTEQFSFEAHKDIEKFDFVTVQANTDEAEWLLAQVQEVEKQPLDDEDKVDDAYKTVAEAEIIGYRHQGLLKKPRSVIEPDSIVYKADQDVIADVLGLNQNGLHMGVLATEPDIDIFLDPEELYKHIAVLAKTGAGKSYATGVLIEELLAKDYPVIIIDPHSEYHTLSEENEIEEAAQEKYGIEPASYTVHEYSPNTDLNDGAQKLDFAATNMDANEIQQVVPTNLTNSQLGVLYSALKELKKQDEYTLDQVIDTCMEQDSKAKWNLINMLEAVRDSGLFADDPTPLEELITPGEASIINLRGVDPEQQEMTVYQLAKELFERRKRGELEPFFMIIEEAHNFVPEKGMGKAVCSDILRTIASEGRKFGLGLGVISQRPANVAKNILSQCNTQLIMRVTNPNDLSAISKSFEGVTKAVEQSITSLPPGVGMVLGKEYPIMTDIRVRKSQHGGETKEVSEDDGLEKREETKDLEDRAAEADVQVETGEEPDETAADEGNGDDQTEEDEERQTITVFKPAMAFEEVQEKLEDPQKAYYPIWIVETAVGRLAVDATDGTVKDRELNLKEDADEVLGLLQDHTLTRQQLVERTGMEDETVTAILDRLQDHDLVHRTDSGYTYKSPDVFSREQQEIEVGGDATVIEPDMDESTAAQTAEAELHTEAESTRLAYYPYYTAGNRVFDAVMGKEV